MAFEDRIIKDRVYKYEGLFDFSELLEIMKDWFGRDRYKYDFKEKLHAESKKAEVKVIKLKWANTRKVDDYHKFIIKVGIEVKGKPKKGQIEGNFKIKVNSIVVRDYDDDWSNSVWKIFMRSVMDKFIESEKEQKVVTQIKKETNSFLNTVKRFFKTK